MRISFRTRRSLASVDAVLALFVVVGLQRAAERAQTVHTEEALRVVDDAFVFTTFSTAGFVAEHVHGVVVSAPDTRSWAPPPDRRN